MLYYRYGKLLINKSPLWRIKKFRWWLPMSLKRRVWDSHHQCGESITVRPVSQIWVVDDSPYHQCGSRRLPVLTIFRSMGLVTSRKGCTMNKILWRTSKIGCRMNRICYRGQNSNRMSRIGYTTSRIDCKEYWTGIWWAPGRIGCRMRR